LNLDQKSAKLDRIYLDPLSMAKASEKPLSIGQKNWQLVDIPFYGWKQ
jgi:hypothetical protein